jgi:two-component system OmpR family response regulator
MNEKVLIIDDDPQYLESLLRTLGIEGIDAIGESNPHRAIEKFQANPTDVVVVDYIYDSYPDYTGLDVIAELRKIKPFTRVILISGRIDHEKMDEDDISSELKGKVLSDYYLPKPGTREKLIETIRAAIEDIGARSTDWKAIAQEYVESEQIDASEIKKIKSKIKNKIISSSSSEGEII